MSRHPCHLQAILGNVPFMAAAMCRAGPPTETSTTRERVKSRPR